jgi:hypothetical protein
MNILDSWFNPENILVVKYIGLSGQVQYNLTYNPGDGVIQVTVDCTEATDEDLNSIKLTDLVEME